MAKVKDVQRTKRKGVSMTIVEEITQKPTIHEVALARTDITNICEAIFEVLLNELPEEAHSIDVFDFLLSETKDMIHSKPIKLQ